MSKAIILFGLGTIMSHQLSHAAPDHKAEALKWRTEREERLKQPTGWLSLVGLHWFKVGSQTLGCGEDNRIKLPKGACPERIGNIELTEDNVVLLHIDKGVRIHIGGSNAPDNSSQKINTSDEKPDVIKAGRLEFTIIKRSKGFGIRVKDPEAPTLKNFKGLSWYEYEPSWRVQAKFVKHDMVKTIKVPNILGGTDDTQSSGYLEFERLGKTHRLLTLD